jgi:hypothetical protein
MPFKSKHDPGGTDAARQRLFSSLLRVPGNSLCSLAIVLTDDNRYLVTDSAYNYLLPVIVMAMLFLVLMGITWMLMRLLSPKHASLKTSLPLLMPTGTRVVSADEAKQPSPGLSRSAPLKSRPAPGVLSPHPPHHPTLKLKFVL